ncbi:hypothetical protein L0337_43815 [candidate division KSB1 bacterium]|nr:hypothetical protein [candidate division KSB1 bacterium]
MKEDHLFHDIFGLARQVKERQERAKELGMFVEDRDLLACPKCGLEEDVTCHGLLIVSKASKRGVDTGLRFSEVDTAQHRFHCPACGANFVAPESHTRGSFC